VEGNWVLYLGTIELWWVTVNFTDYLQIRMAKLSNSCFAC